MVHAHGLVGRPFRRGVHPRGVDVSLRKGLPLGRERAQFPKDRLDFGRVVQRESSNQQRPVFSDSGTECVAVLGRPPRRVAERIDAHDRRFAVLALRR